MEQQRERKVEIATRLIDDEEGGLVEIKVTDNGPGFLNEICSTKLSTLT